MSWPPFKPVTGPKKPLHRHSYSFMSSKMVIWRCIPSTTPYHPRRDFRFRSCLHLRHVPFSFEIFEYIVAEIPGERYDNWSVRAGYNSDIGRCRPNLAVVFRVMQGLEYMLPSVYSSFDFLSRTCEINTSKWFCGGVHWSFHHILKKCHFDFTLRRVWCLLFVEGLLTSAENTSRLWIYSWHEFFFPLRGFGSWF